MAYFDQRGRSSHSSHGYDNGYHVHDKPSSSYRYSSTGRLRDRDARDYDRRDDSRDDYDRRTRSQDRYAAPVARPSRGRHHDRHASSTSRSTSASASAHRRRRSSSFSVFGDERDRELKHVVTSALTAGAVEAFRLRKSPGTWAHDKAGRVATAALGAAVADTAAESKSPHSKHARRHVVEATMAGLLTDRLVNGSRKR